MKNPMDVKIHAQRTAPTPETLVGRVRLMDELKAIGSEMVQQNNRATENVMFVIEVDKKVWVTAGEDYDERERVEDTNEFMLCESCAKDFEESGGERPLESCEQCDEECFNHYRIERTFDLRAGVFLTAKACNEHIQANAYHYDNPKSFGISAWRNPEMQAVMQMLIFLSGNDVPSQYRREP